MPETAFLSRLLSLVIFCGLPATSIAQVEVKLDQLTGSEGVVISGSGSLRLFGVDVASAGDINGDGFPDIIVGAPGTRIAIDMSTAASAHVIFGTREGWPAVIEVDQLDGSNGFTLLDAVPGGEFGESVSSAGDLNGDGIDDLVIGAYRAFNSRGRAYVFFGSRAPFNAVENLDALTGANGFVIDGLEPFDEVGYSVGSAGDINGDGVDDIVIGAAGAGPDDEGGAYLIFGSRDAFPPSIDLSNLTVEDGFFMVGIANLDLTGFAVNPAGDLNDDQMDDFVIGSLALQPGDAYVVFGSNQPYPSTLNLADLNGSDGFIIRGEDSADRAGTAVDAGGDLNGDGIDDLIVGAPGGDPTTNGGSFFFEEGETYVVYGRSAGFPALVELANLTTSQGYVITGVQREDRSGVAVAGAGDFNQDGINDLLIGARQNQDGTGLAYLVLGSAAERSVFALDTIGPGTGLVFEGLAIGDGLGISVDGLGDVNGDGFDDVIVGAPFVDEGEDEDAGEAYVIFGNSTVFSNGFED